MASSAEEGTNPATAYRLSGRAGSVALLPVLGAVPAAACALVYAYLDVHVPLYGYVSIALVAGLAIGSALPIAYAARLLKVRNRLWARVAGGLVGVIAVYLAWAMFLAVLYASNGIEDMPGAFELIASPGLMWEHITALAETGWYSVLSYTPSGAELWMLWGIEVVIVAGTCAYVATSRIDESAFCEDCGKWCWPDTTVWIPTPKHALAKSVRKRGLAAIEAGVLPDPSERRQLRIATQKCPSCARVGAYRVDDVFEQRKDRTIKVVTTPVVELSVLTPDAEAEIERVVALMRAAKRAHFDNAKRKLSEE